MIEINNLRLCEHCFSQLHDAHECTECKDIGEHSPDGLPENTVLQGRYIVGKQLYGYTGYYGYIGFDTQNNSRVLIRELFPDGLHASRKNKNLEIINAMDNEKHIKKCFASFEKDFCAEVNNMIQVSDDTSVAKVHNLFNENNTAYCIIDFPEGSVLLSDLIKINGGRLSEEDAVEVLEKVASAVDKIHSHGLIHGNIRPENIIVSENSVLVTGFQTGFKYLNDTTGADYLYGEYAPHELVNSTGTPDKYSDIYALGATVYYTLTGKRVKHCIQRITADDDRIYMQGISPKLAAIISKMLALKPLDRYADIYELIKDLNKAGLSKMKIAPTKNNSSKVAKPKGKKKGLTAIIIILILAILVSAGLVVFFATDLFKGKKKTDTETTDKQTSSEVVTEENSDEENDENAEDAEKQENSETESENSESEEEGTANNEEDTPDNVTDTENAEEENSDKENGAEKEETPEKDTPDESEEVGEEEKKPFPFTPENKEEDKEDEKPLNTIFSKNWKNNVMTDTSLYSEYDTAVFGNKDYKKSQIIAITVLDSLDGMPEDAWDISHKADKSVMAWVTPAEKKNTYNLYLGANGGINAERSTERLFADYVNAESIEFNGNFHTDYAESTAFMFYNCKKVKSLSLDGIDTGSVTDMSHMFENCHVAESITLGKAFDTKKVKNMAEMFDGCFNITELDLSMFNTFIVNNMSSMFYKCTKLKTLDLSSFNTVSVSTMAKMFEDCHELESLDLSSFSAKNNTNVSDMFVNCNKLANLSVTSELIENEYNKTLSVQ